VVLIEGIYPRQPSKLSDTPVSTHKEWHDSFFFRNEGVPQPLHQSDVYSFYFIKPSTQVSTYYKVLLHLKDQSGSQNWQSKKGAAFGCSYINDLQRGLPSVEASKGDPVVKPPTTLVIYISRATISKRLHPESMACSGMIVVGLTWQPAPDTYRQVLHPHLTSLVLTFFIPHIESPPPPPRIDADRSTGHSQEGRTYLPCFGCHTHCHLESTVPARSRCRQLVPHHYTVSFAYSLTSSPSVSPEPQPTTLLRPPTCQLRRNLGLLCAKMSCRKKVERAFGMPQSRFSIVTIPFSYLDKIWDVEGHKCLCYHA
jgi:hypothetical protein